MPWPLKLYIPQAASSTEPRHYPRCLGQLRVEREKRAESRTESVVVPDAQNIELVAEAVWPTLSVVKISGTKLGQIVEEL